MQVHDLVAGFATAIESDDPMASVRAVLADLRNDLDDVAEVLSYVSGIGGNAMQIFYRSPSLSLLKVNFQVADARHPTTTAPGRQFWSSPVSRKTRSIAPTTESCSA